MVAPLIGDVGKGGARVPPLVRSASKLDLAVVNQTASLLLAVFFVVFIVEVSDVGNRR